MNLRHIGLGFIRPATYLFAGTAFLLSCAWVGFMFGWLVGASQSPIASTGAPLVFGLLAIIGVGTGAVRSGPKLSNLCSTGSIAVGVVLFCIFTRVGLSHGVRDRADPFITYEAAIGTENWNAVDSDVAHELYRLRWLMRERGLHREEFRLYLADVIAPIVESQDLSKDEKLAALKRSTTAVEQLRPAK